MKRTFLLIVLTVALNSAIGAQDSITLYMELPIGPGSTVTFIQDPIETTPTSLPASFFGMPMQPTHVRDGSQYILKLRLPRAFNYFVFRVENAYSDKALVGCFGTSKDASFRLKGFDYVDSVENSMDLYREAKRLESKGKNRKANKLYEKAASIGNVLAMRKLADHYRDGVGCWRSPKRAYYWYQQASYFGDEYAEAMIRGEGYKHKVKVSVMGKR